MSSAVYSMYSSSVGGGLLLEEPMMVLRKALDEIRQQPKLPPDDERHNWQRWWDERHCQSVLQVLSDTNTSASGTVNDSDEQLMYVMYELTKRRSRYTADELRAMQQFLSTSGISQLRFERFASAPEWLIAPYDVEFDPLPFSRGSFGTVHRGKWMGKNVVVKKLILTPGQETRQREAFYRELGIWYHLHHDNIVKLYGACHVGEPFFVCESAELGHLDPRPSKYDNYRHSDDDYGTLSMDSPSRRSGWTSIPSRERNRPR